MHWYTCKSLLNTLGNAVWVTPIALPTGCGFHPAPYATHFLLEPILKPIFIASFPGPAQLFVACSTVVTATESWARPGNEVIFYPGIHAEKTEPGLNSPENGGVKREWSHSTIHLNTNALLSSPMTIIIWSSL